MCVRGLDMLQQNKIIHGNHQRCKIWIQEVQEQEI
jgi:hypothetical protein